MTLYIILISILVLVVMMVLIPRFKKRKIMNKIGQLTTIVETKERGYDFKTIIDNNEYLTKVLIIESESSLQINSKYYWQLNYGYKKNSTDFKHMRLLNELNTFLRLDNENKLLLIYPKVRNIKKYINESELKFVESGETVHGIKVYNYTDFINDF